ncbi:nucleobase:cation symporter-2 family protein [Paraglaciecola sp. MB-3u-78]|uniref:nucleobase:cation symporter-2 family protein n=1 Tax=Paraglaciecola sp. MB-3u-78 TaxID=2058332 RepID=UPI000C342AAD|nr:nucleobase:cation symporter-2 family protein [Paraglaciecola sp. MB-3u-78]PKG97675.1 purine permease [Paraglaciecola sp. MB-3u-78]
MPPSDTPTETKSSGIHPVDQRLPIAPTALLGLQHVLVMYSACIIVPLILGAALQLPKETLSLIINADLFAAGLATLVQCFGNRYFGIKLPIMMGVTFTSIAPMIAIGVNPELGLPGIYGAIIVSGIFGILFAPIMGRLLRFFPPVVTGSVLLVIGISLMKVGIEWSAGGSPTLADGSTNPDFGKPIYLLVSLLQLSLILLINRFAKGFLSNVSVLIAMIAGFIAAWLLGDISLKGLNDEPWVALIKPLSLGMPTFDFLAICSMSLVMLVTMVESTGMFLALGKLVDKEVDQKQLVRGLRSDGLGTLLGGLFNAFPYTSFSQNIGLVTISGVKSRYVAAAGAFILIALGCLPKMAFIIASIPQYALGAAAMVMFGTVALMGVRILSEVDFTESRSTLLVVSASLGIGLIPMIAPSYFQHLPQWSHIFTDSGIILSVCTAILLNAIFSPSPEQTNKG